MTQEKILEEYKKKADEIIKRMYQIATRSQRKQDDVNYKKIVNNLS